MKDYKSLFWAAEDRLMQTPPGERRELWDNVEPETEPTPGEFRPTGWEKLDAIVRASRAPFLYGGNSAVTMTDVGTITLPEPERFHSPADYARTVAHELAHWTGWGGELGRPTPTSTPLRDFLGLPPVGYPREEMTAEIGAVLLMDAAGVPHDLAYSSAYYRNWRQALEGSPEGKEDGALEAADAWAREHAEEAAEMLLDRAGM